MFSAMWNLARLFSALQMGMNRLVHVISCVGGLVLWEALSVALARECFFGCDHVSGAGLKVWLL